MATLNSWQKISRVLSSDFGDGASGSATISSDPNTRATITGTATQTTGTAGSTAFTNGDLVMLHQTQGTGAGQWEINSISSGGGSTSLTFSKALQYTYGTGAQIIKIPRYTTATIAAHSPTAWNGTTGGIEVVCAKTSISTSGTLNGNALGFAGGTGTLTGNDYTGKQGAGTAGAGTNSNSANGNGGGGGQRSPGTTKAGGGGGGHAATGTAGQSRTYPGGAGGAAVGSADLISLNLGGGGGQGAYWWDVGGGTGGRGGAALIFFTKSFTPTNAITVNGSNGSASSGGCGGGAGGGILVVCDTATGIDNLTAAAGAGGVGGDSTGGAGSVGRIAVHYKTSVSGTSSPASTNTQDTTLKEGGNNNFFMFF